MEIWLPEDCEYRSSGTKNTGTPKLRWLEYLAALAVAAHAVVAFPTTEQYTANGASAMNLALDMRAVLAELQVRTADPPFANNRGCVFLSISLTSLVKLAAVSPREGGFSAKE